MNPAQYSSSYANLAYGSGSATALAPSQDNQRMSLHLLIDTVPRSSVLYSCGRGPLFEETSEQSNQSEASETRQLQFPKPETLALLQDFGQHDQRCRRQDLVALPFIWHAPDEHAWWLRLQIVRARTRVDVRAPPRGVQAAARLYPELIPVADIRNEATAEQLGRTDQLCA